MNYIELFLAQKRQNITDTDLTISSVEDVVDTGFDGGDVRQVAAVLEGS